MAHPIIPLPEGGKISVGSSGKRKARVLRSEFGGGYSQRVPDGLNSVRLEYTIVVETLTRAEGKAIDDFLTERKGAYAFQWQPPGKPMLKWTCEEWDVAHTSVMHDTFSGVFTQVFDP